MKKYIIGLLLVLGMAGNAFAVPSYGTTVPSTLFSAATATAVGTGVNLGTPVAYHLCTLTWGGTAPTNVVVSIDGSGDGTNYYSLTGSLTITASPYLIPIDVPSVKYLRGTWTSTSGGDATTSLTITCVSGGMM